MASSSLTPVMKDGERVNWVELPSELTSSILRRLCAVDIFKNAQKVCTSWRHVCKDPFMWRKIDMRNLGNLEHNLDRFMWRKIDMHNQGDLVFNLEIMCRHAVDRSQGGLVEIDISYFATDSLLNYIADRPSSLRSLRLVKCPLVTTCEGLAKALAKLPLLEELEFSNCSLLVESLRLVGQSCPNLKTLKLNKHRFKRPRYVSDCDEDALAIGGTMPGLRFLQLLGNMLSDVGLNAILNNCPNLEHLDLRHCFKVNIVGDLEKRCLERIKVLRRPRDSLN